jgi:ribosomal protein L12E/L44/L45/RPP1/RPP2
MKTILSMILAATFLVSLPAIVRAEEPAPAADGAKAKSKKKDDKKEEKKEEKKAEKASW